MNNTTPPTNLKPTPGWEFPTDLGDKIDQNLKRSVSKLDPRNVQSVRPGREVGKPPRVMIPDPEPAGAKVTTPMLAQHSQSGSVSSDTTVPDGAVMKPNLSPPITPMDTADMTAVDLPSRFAYYPFKDLYAKPLRVSHLSKMSQAADASSMQLIAEVVSSVLATPGGDTNIAFQLSVNDLNSVLYWLRANSFKKKTMRVNHTCSNPHHHESVVKGERSRESLENESTHDTSTLKTVYLDPKPDPEHYHLKVEIRGQSYRIDLRPETVMDSIEFLDDPRFIDESFQYMARIASMLDLDSAFPRLDDKGVHQRWTLHEKIEVVEDHLTNDDVLLVLEFSELVDRFGIDEWVKVKCKECGYEEQIKLVVDARTFSSPRF